MKHLLSMLSLSTEEITDILNLADQLKYENKNGIVDCFDDDKYIPAEWMRKFNSDAVLLAEMEDMRAGINEQIVIDQTLGAGTDIFTAEFSRLVTIFTITKHRGKTLCRRSS